MAVDPNIIAESLANVVDESQDATPDTQQADWDATHGTLENPPPPGSGAAITMPFIAQSTWGLTEPLDPSQSPSSYENALKILEQQYPGDEIFNVPGFELDPELELEKVKRHRPRLSEGALSMRPMTGFGDSPSFPQQLQQEYDLRQRDLRSEDKDIEQRIKDYDQNIVDAYLPSFADPTPLSLDLQQKLAVLEMGGPGYVFAEDGTGIQGPGGIKVTPQEKALIAQYKKEQKKQKDREESRSWWSRISGGGIDGREYKSGITMLSEENVYYAYLAQGAPVETAILKARKDYRFAAAEIGQDLIDQGIEVLIPWPTMDFDEKLGTILTRAVPNWLTNLKEVANVPEVASALAMLVWDTTKLGFQGKKAKTFYLDAFKHYLVTMWGTDPAITEQYINFRPSEAAGDIMAILGPILSYGTVALTKVASLKAVVKTTNSLKKKHGVEGWVSKTLLDKKKLWDAEFMKNYGAFTPLATDVGLILIDPGFLYDILPNYLFARKFGALMRKRVENLGRLGAEDVTFENLRTENVASAEIVAAFGAEDLTAKAVARFIREQRDSVNTLEEHLVLLDAELKKANQVITDFEAAATKAITDPTGHITELNQLNIDKTLIQDQIDSITSDVNRIRRVKPEDGIISLDAFTPKRMTVPTAIVLGYEALLRDYAKATKVGVFRFSSRQYQRFHSDIVNMINRAGSLISDRATPEAVGRELLEGWKRVQKLEDARLQYIYGEIFGKWGEIDVGMNPFRNTIYTIEKIIKRHKKAGQARGVMKSRVDALTNMLTDMKALNKRKTTFHDVFNFRSSYRMEGSLQKYFGEHASALPLSSGMGLEIYNRGLSLDLMDAAERAAQDPNNFTVNSSGSPKTPAGSGTPGSGQGRSTGDGGTTGASASQTTTPKQQPTPDLSIDVVAGPPRPDMPQQTGGLTSSIVADQITSSLFQRRNLIPSPSASELSSGSGMGGLPSFGAAVTEITAAIDNLYTSMPDADPNKIYDLVQEKLDQNPGAHPFEIAKKIREATDPSETPGTPETPARGESVVDDVDTTRTLVDDLIASNIDSIDANAAVNVAMRSALDELDTRIEQQDIPTVQDPDFISQLEQLITEALDADNSVNLDQSSVQIIASRVAQAIQDELVQDTGVSARGEGDDIPGPSVGRQIEGDTVVEDPPKTLEPASDEALSDIERSWFADDSKLPDASVIRERIRVANMEKRLGVQSSLLAKQGRSIPELQGETPASVSGYIKDSIIRRDLGLSTPADAKRIAIDVQPGDLDRVSETLFYSLIKAVDPSFIGMNNTEIYSALKLENIGVTAARLPIDTLVQNWDGLQLTIDDILNSISVSNGNIISIEISKFTDAVSEAISGRKGDAADWVNVDELIADVADRIDTTDLRSKDVFHTDYTHSNIASRLGPPPFELEPLTVTSSIEQISDVLYAYFNRSSKLATDEPFHIYIRPHTGLDNLIFRLVSSVESPDLINAPFRDIQAQYPYHVHKLAALFHEKASIYSPDNPQIPLDTLSTLIKLAIESDNATTMSRIDQITADLNKFVGLYSREDGGVRSMPDMELDFTDGIMETLQEFSDIPFMDEASRAAIQDNIQTAVRTILQGSESLAHAIRAVSDITEITITDFSSPLNAADLAEKFVTIANSKYGETVSGDVELVNRIEAQQSRADQPRDIDLMDTEEVDTDLPEGEKEVKTDLQTAPEIFHRLKEDPENAVKELQEIMDSTTSDDIPDEFKIENIIDNMNDSDSAASALATIIHTFIDDDFEHITVQDFNQYQARNSVIFKKLQEELGDAKLGEFNRTALLEELGNLAKQGYKDMIAELRKLERKPETGVVDYDELSNVIDAAFKRTTDEVIELIPELRKKDAIKSRGSFNEFMHKQFNFLKGVIAPEEAAPVNHGKVLQVEPDQISRLENLRESMASATIQRIIDSSSDPKIKTQVREIYHNYITGSEGLDLKGYKVSSAAEAAALVQAYRHPFVEREWALVIKDDVVVGHTGWTLNKEFEVNANFDIIKAHVDIKKADFVYLVHNHPDRNVTFSKRDELSFEEMEAADKYPGLVNKLININGGTHSELARLPDGTTRKTENQPIPEELLGWDPTGEADAYGVKTEDPLYKGATAPEEMQEFFIRPEQHGAVAASVAKRLNTENNWATLVIMDQSNRIISMHETESIVNPRLYEELKNAVRGWNGRKVHFVVGKGDWYSSWDEGARYLQNKLGNFMKTGAEVDPIFLKDGVSSVWLDGQNIVPEQQRAFMEKNNITSSIESSFPRESARIDPQLIHENTQVGDAISFEQARDATSGVGGRGSPDPSVAGDFVDVPYNGFLSRTMFGNTMMNWVNNNSDLANTIGNISENGDLLVTTEGLAPYLTTNIVNSVIHNSYAGGSLRIVGNELENRISSLLSTSIENFISDNQSWNQSNQRMEIDVAKVTNRLNDSVHVVFGSDIPLDGHNRLSEANISSTVDMFVQSIDDLSSVADEVPVSDAGTIQRLKALDTNFREAFNLDIETPLYELFGPASTAIMSGTSLRNGLRFYFRNTYLTDPNANWIDTNRGIQELDRIKSLLTDENDQVVLTKLYGYLQFGDAITNGATLQNAIMATRLAIENMDQRGVIGFLENMYPITRQDLVDLNRVPIEEMQASSATMISENAPEGVDELELPEIVEELIQFFTTPGYDRYGLRDDFLSGTHDQNTMGYTVREYFESMLVEWNHQAAENVNQFMEVISREGRVEANEIFHRLLNTYIHTTRQRADQPDSAIVSAVSEFQNNYSSFGFPGSHAYMSSVDITDHLLQNAQTPMQNIMEENLEYIDMDGVYNAFGRPEDGTDTPVMDQLTNNQQPQREGFITQDEFDAEFNNLNRELNNPYRQRHLLSKMEYEYYQGNLGKIESTQELIDNIDTFIAGTQRQVTDDYEYFKLTKDPNNDFPITQEEMLDTIKSGDYKKGILEDLQDRMIEFQKRTRDYESSAFYRDPKTYYTAPTSPEQLDLIFNQMDSSFNEFVGKYSTENVDLIDSMKNLEQSDLNEMARMLSHVERRYTQLIDNFERLNPRPEAILPTMKRINDLATKIRHLGDYIDNPASPIARRQMAQYFGYEPTVIVDVPEVLTKTPANLQQIYDDIITKIDTELTPVDQLTNQVGKNFNDAIQNISDEYRSISNIIREPDPNLLNMTGENISGQLELGEATPEQTQQRDLLEQQQGERDKSIQGLVDSIKGEVDAEAQRPIEGEEGIPQPVEEAIPQDLGSNIPPENRDASIAALASSVEQYKTNGLLPEFIRYILDVAFTEGAVQESFSQYLESIDPSASNMFSEIGDIPSNELATHIANAITDNSNMEGAAEDLMTAIGGTEAPSSGITPRGADDLPARTTPSGIEQFSDKATENVTESWHSQFPLLSRESITDTMISQWDSSPDIKFYGSLEIHYLPGEQQGRNRSPGIKVVEDFATAEQRAGQTRRGGRITGANPGFIYVLQGQILQPGLMDPSTVKPIAVIKASDTGGYSMEGGMTMQLFQWKQERLTVGEANSYMNALAPIMSVQQGGMLARIVGKLGPGYRTRSMLLKLNQRVGIYRDSGEYIKNLYSEVRKITNRAMSPAEGLFTDKSEFSPDQIRETKPLSAISNEQIQKWNDDPNIFFRGDSELRNLFNMKSEDMSHSKNPADALAKARYGAHKLFEEGHEEFSKYSGSENATRDSALENVNWEFVTDGLRNQGKKLKEINTKMWNEAAELLTMMGRPVEFIPETHKGPGIYGKGVFASDMLFRDWADVTPLGVAESPEHFGNYVAVIKADPPDLKGRVISEGGVIVNPKEIVEIIDMKDTGKFSYTPEGEEVNFLGSYPRATPEKLQQQYERIYDDFVGFNLGENMTDVIGEFSIEIERSPAGEFADLETGIEGNRRLGQEAEKFLKIRISSFIEGMLYKYKKDPENAHAWLIKELLYPATGMLSTHDRGPLYEPGHISENPIHNFTKTHQGKDFINNAEVSTILRKLDETSASKEQLADMFSGMFVGSEDIFEGADISDIYTHINNELNIIDGIDTKQTLLDARQSASDILDEISIETSEMTPVTGNNQNQYPSITQEVADQYAGVRFIHIDALSEGTIRSLEEIPGIYFYSSPMKEHLEPMANGYVINPSKTLADSGLAKDPAYIYILSGKQTGTSRSGRIQMRTENVDILAVIAVKDIENRSGIFHIKGTDTGGTPGVAEQGREQISPRGAPKTAKDPGDTAQLMKDLPGMDPAEAITQTNRLYRADEEFNNSEFVKSLYKILDDPIEPNYVKAANLVLGELRNSDRTAIWLNHIYKNVGMKATNALRAHIISDILQRSQSGISMRDPDAPVGQAPDPKDALRLRASGLRDEISKLQSTTIQIGETNPITGKIAEQEETISAIQGILGEEWQDVVDLFEGLSYVTENAQTIDDITGGGKNLIQNSVMQLTFRSFINSGAGIYGFSQLFSLLSGSGNISFVGGVALAAVYGLLYSIGSDGYTAYRNSLFGGYIWLKGKKVPLPPLNQIIKEGYWPFAKILRHHSSIRIASDTEKQQDVYEDANKLDFLAPVNPLPRLE